MKKYKILFCDLDGTLIKTKSGETFPKGIWDMELRLEVFDAIKDMWPNGLFIVSNQRGIASGYVNKDNFDVKLKYVCTCIKEYVNTSVGSIYCPENNDYAKPSPKMLENLFIEINKYEEYKSWTPITKDDCLMIGNASGKEGQFSDTDKKTAENFGIDYLDVDDFVEQMKND